MLVTEAVDSESVRQQLQAVHHLNLQLFALHNLLIRCQDHWGIRKHIRLQQCPSHHF